MSYARPGDSHDLEPDRTRRQTARELARRTSRTLRPTTASAMSSSQTVTGAARPAPVIQGSLGVISPASAVRARSQDNGVSRHRDLAVGLLRVGTELGAHADDLLPYLAPLLTGHLLDLHPPLRPAELDPYLVGMGSEIVIPGRMTPCAARRGDDIPTAPTAAAAPRGCGGSRRQRCRRAGRRGRDAAHNGATPPRRIGQSTGINPFRTVSRRSARRATPPRRRDPLALHGARRRPVAGRATGDPQALARFWTTSYDWRRFEAKLNALPQFTTEIDGVDIHFIHVRARHTARCR